MPYQSHPSHPVADAYQGIIPPSYTCANQSTSMRLPCQPVRYASGHSQSSAYQSRLAPSHADLCRALLFRSIALHISACASRRTSSLFIAITSRFAAVGRSALLRLCAATARPGPAPLLHSCAYHRRATHCPLGPYRRYASAVQCLALSSQVNALLLHCPASQFDASPHCRRASPRLPMPSTR